VLFTLKEPPIICLLICIQYPLNPLIIISLQLHLIFSNELLLPLLYICLISLFTNTLGTSPVMMTLLFLLVTGTFFLVFHSFMKLLLDFPGK
jgi:hypothetical protein